MKIQEFSLRTTKQLRRRAGNMINWLEARDDPKKKKWVYVRGWNNEIDQLHAYYIEYLDKKKARLVELRLKTYRYPKRGKTHLRIVVIFESLAPDER